MIAPQSAALAEVTDDARRQSAGEAERLAARRAQADRTDAGVVAPVPERPLAPGQTYKLCTVCRAIGHGSLYCAALLKRPDWKVYPNQKWFVDDVGNQYFCPKDGRMVDFTDEMYFSRLAMFLKGRQCLENKMKVSQLVPHLLPESYFLVDMLWVDGRSPQSREGDLLPWFIKEAEGNEGTFVHCYPTVSQCLELAKPGKNYVVQQHVRDPLLYEGRKFHFRFHILIICEEDGKTWSLYTYNDGYLNISPSQWSPYDIARDTQVVIYRSQRIGDWEHWHDVYSKSKASVVEAIGAAVTKGKLEGRLGKKQFEIASLDCMVDTHGKVWILEFNMGPVLRDAKLDPELNDEEMVARAFDIVLPFEDPPNRGRWELVGEFIGETPLDPEPMPTQQVESVSGTRQVAKGKIIEEPVDDAIVDDILNFLDGLA